MNLIITAYEHLESLYMLEGSATIISRLGRARSSVIYNLELLEAASTQTKW